LGQHLKQEAWHSIFRQLIHKGFIEQDIANYSVLKIKERARPVLVGEEKVFLAKPRTTNLEVTKKVKNPAKKLVAQGAHPELFEELRRLRRTLSEQANVPSFIIFSDATLQELADKLPQDEAAFLAINGVGQKKLENYGQQFIELIRQHLLFRSP
jgi:ATP-dependent DNA helicase RecQ